MTDDQRQYELSHSWLSFTVRPYLDRAPGKLWWLLGRTCALIEQMAQTPLRPQVAHELHMLYMVKGAQATTAIEGNTLTEEQVREIIEKNVKLKPSKEYLAKEVRNVANGFVSIARDLSQGHQPEVSPERIRELNRIVLKELAVDDGVVPGEWRTHSVHVGPYLAPPPADTDYLVKQLCDWLAGPELAGQETHQALLRAVLAHLYLEWIHPFGDGNGRTGRLLEFQILLSAGLLTAAVHLLSNHYNQTRSEYYRQLERSSKNGGDFMPFLLYALQGLLDGLEEQHDLLRNDLERLVWRDLVDELLGPEQTRADQRRRALASGLYEVERALSLGEFFKNLPELVPWYDDKTTKTLTRDLNLLKSHDLLVKEGGRWRARREIVMGLRPDLARP
jgi:Fic family protein